VISMPYARGSVRGVSTVRSERYVLSSQLIQSNEIAWTYVR
jgi:hypothetical protein